MTREAKVGLMMVAVLIGVFGFLLYKRIHRPAEAYAGQRATEEVGAATDDSDVPQQFGDELLPRRKKETTRIGRDVMKIERGAGKAVKSIENAAEGAAKLAIDTIEEINPFESEKPKRPKASLPTEIPSDNDEFAEFEKPGNRNRRSAPAELPDPVDVAFQDNREQLAPPRRAAVEIGTTASDPFGEEIADTVKQVEFTEPPRRDRSASIPTEIDERPAAQGSRRTAEVLEVEIDLVEPRRTREFDGMEQSPREKRRPTPISLADDNSFPAASSQATGGIEGDRYTVQPNDNFWSISRKRYGAGRYFMALARHNQKVIPDPKMMKPGIVIATPDASILEQNYGDVIPKAGPIDSESPVAATQVRKSVTAERAGYFVANDGAPMYRVGDQDTLTGIAKSHLGRTSRWVQILEMNRNVLRDGNELKIGTVLRLPADASHVQIVGTAREYR